MNFIRRSSIFAMDIFNRKNMKNFTNNRNDRITASTIANKRNALDLISKEKQYIAPTHCPLEVVISRADGIFLYDTNRSRYFDFLSGYSAVNQGHLHPDIIRAAHCQLKKQTLNSRAFYNDVFSTWAEYICKRFDYNQVMAQNSGVEAVETAVKLARRFGVIMKNQSTPQIISFRNNFHGRTLGALSASSNELYRKDFGPFDNGFVNLPYNDVASVENELVKNPNISAILVEPIQGEGGINVPDADFMAKMKLCSLKHNVLLIADEIQTGLGRTGKMLCTDYSDIKPDVHILGKSLGGGVIPISCILSNNLNLFDLGSHGTTFGGNPLACAISIESVKVIDRYKLVRNSFVRGQQFRDSIVPNKLIKEVRGKGLLNGIEFDKNTMRELRITPHIICNELMKNGLLTKNNGDVIRFCPPLTITKDEMNKAVEIINDTLNQIIVKYK